MAKVLGVDVGELLRDERVATLAQAVTTLATATAQLAGAASTVASALASEAAAGLSEVARGGAELVSDARETVQTFRRLAVRADAIVAELEEPLLALAPGLRRLASVLDDPVVDDLPATLRQVQENVLPVLRTLAETHERVAFIAGQSERIMAFVDDAGRSFAGLPGAALLARRRPSPRVVTVEQDPPLR